MSFSARRCEFCLITVPDDELWRHVEDLHSNLKTVSFTKGGQTMNFSLFVESFEECAYEPTEKDLATDIPPKPTDPFFDLGLSHDSMRNTPHDNIGDGGKFSQDEWNHVLAATSRLGGTGFKLDRNRFIASLIRFLLTQDASPLLDDKGSVVLFSEAADDGSGFEGSIATEEVSWSKVLASWIEALGPHSRLATMRRAARSLAPAMMTQIKTASYLRDLSRNGTPLSQKFGIPHQFYYTAVSFFPAIKNPGDWSTEEYKYTKFRVDHTVVESSEPKPMDTRPGLGSADEHQSPGSRVIREVTDRSMKKVNRGVTTKDLIALAKQRSAEDQGFGFGNGAF